MKNGEIQKINQKVREALTLWFINSNGTTKNDFQGAYVLALKMQLVLDHMQGKMIEHLVDMVKKN